MYSAAVSKLLKDKKIVPGDRIAIVKNGERSEGLLIPKGESGDPDVLVIKMDSGYNIGFSLTGATIEKVGAGKELGKVGGKLLELTFDPKKPPVSMVACGGTIASRVDYKTGGVYAAADPRDFLHNVPELQQTINLHTIVRPVTKMSEDLGHEDWISIAKAVHQELKHSNGVIVTHGTDTMHYTAAALSFFLRGLGKPVVLVGSQISSDRGASDAGMNLACAAQVAISNLAEVGICMHATMNDDYCFFSRGTKVRKMHTIRRDAFRPINELPLAKVYPDRLEVTHTGAKKRTDAVPELDAVFEPKVALVKVHPSADPGVLEYYKSKGYKGFVIEGTGLGHVPTQATKSWIPTITKLVKDGLPVVVTAQPVYGRVNPYVYTNLRILYGEARAIPGEDMLAETALVKLGWLLAHTQDLAKIREQMATNLAGEINERSQEETFLY